MQIDIREEQLGRRSHLDLGLVGGIAESLLALLPRFERKSDRSYLNVCLNNYRETREGLNDLATGKPGQRPIHLQYLATILNEVSAEDAIFTVDVGTPVIWAAR